MTFLKKITTLAPLAILVVPFAASASKLIPDCATGNGLCGINDIVQTFINFTRLLLGFVGAAVLIMFVYGGFVWLTSGGGEGVKKGMAIVRNAGIGLLIVFGAYTGIQFVFTSFSAQKSARVGQECTSTTGDARGIYAMVTIAQDQPPEIQCVTTCGGTELKNYSCMSADVGKNCVFGLCTDPTLACCLPQ